MCVLLSLNAHSQQHSIACFRRCLFTMTCFGWSHSLFCPRTTDMHCQGTACRRPREAGVQHAVASSPQRPRLAQNSNTHAASTPTTPAPPERGSCLWEALITAVEYQSVDETCVLLNALGPENLFHPSSQLGTVLWKALGSPQLFRASTDTLHALQPRWTAEQLPTWRAASLDRACREGDPVRTRTVLTVPTPLFLSPSKVFSLVELALEGPAEITALLSDERRRAFPGPHVRQRVMEQLLATNPEAIALLGAQTPEGHKVSDRLFFLSCAKGLSEAAKTLWYASHMNCRPSYEMERLLQEGFLHACNAYGTLLVHARAPEGPQWGALLEFLVGQGAELDTVVPRLLDESRNGTHANGGMAKLAHDLQHGPLLWESSFSVLAEVRHCVLTHQKGGGGARRSLAHSDTDDEDVASVGSATSSPVF